MLEQVPRARVLVGQWPPAERGRWTTLSVGVLLTLWLTGCATFPEDEFSIREPIRLPLTMVQSNPATNVMVGDLEVQIGIDTGGGIIDLSGDVIRKVGGKKMPGTNTWTDWTGQEIRAQLFKIPSVTIDGRTFRNLVAEQANEPPSGEGRGLPNSLGRDFLRHYFVVIDYGNSALTLWPPTSSAMASAQCGSQRIPMESTKESGLVVVRLATPSGSFRAILDTGAQYSVIPEELARDRNLPLIFRGETPFYKLEGLTVAGQDLGPLEFVVLPANPPDDFQVFLGSNFFSKHVVCLDYRNREILVQ